VIVRLTVRLHVYSGMMLLTVQRDRFARAIFGRERLVSVGHVHLRTQTIYVYVACTHIIGLTGRPGLSVVRCDSVSSLISNISNSLLRTRFILFYFDANTTRTRVFKTRSCTFLKYSTQYLPY